MKHLFLLAALVTFFLAGCNSSGNTDQSNGNNENLGKTEETIPGLSLKITKNFNVAPELVFDVFTKPEAMKTWWTETTTFDIDLKVGGSWKIVRTEGENVYTAVGEYFEVNRPGRLVYTYAMPQFSSNADTITIDIASDGEGGSVLTFEHSGKDIASELEDLPEDTISESEKGWRYGFDLMEAAWAGQDPF